MYDLTIITKSPDGASAGDMASLTPKVIKGKTYYYARECRRVNGKPKIVRTTYLGSLDNIIAAVEGAREAPRPHSVEIASFGDVVALYDLAQNIGLAEIIDRHVPKRKQGLSPGQYLLLPEAVLPDPKPLPALQLLPRGRLLFFRIRL